MTLENLIINCIECVLMNEGYSLKDADSKINWSWSCIDYFILKYKNEVNKECGT